MSALIRTGTDKALFGDPTPNKIFHMPMTTTTSASRTTTTMKSTSLTTTKIYSPRASQDLGKPSKEKTGNILVFYQ